MIFERIKEIFEPLPFLPEGTLVGNPLWAPIYNGHSYNLEFLSAQNNLLLAAMTHKPNSEKIAKKPYSMNYIEEGTLSLQEIIWRRKILIGTITITQSYFRPLNISEGVERNLLTKKEYEEILKERLPEEKQLIDEARQINPIQNTCYEVTKEGSDCLLMVNFIRSDPEKKKSGLARILSQFEPIMAQ